MIKKIGITGGIGSGKSVVCNLFKTLGIPVFDADLEAKKLLETPQVKEFYLNECGQQVFINGELNRQKIASLIFNNENLLRKVNEFIHPLVYKQFESWTNMQTAANFVIHEAALIFESKGNELLDATILVYAPLEVRIRRVIERDSVSRQQVLERIKNQMDEEKKRELANIVIVNDGSTLVIPQVLNIHKNIISENFKK